MKKTFSKKKSAFSLIELSIVLIIIGLLIAGVTGGASLIKSSELRAAMSEARAYTTSVNGFYTQFGYLPGDYGTVIGSSLAGDGDGKIEGFVDADLSESHNAWAQMKAAAVIDSGSVSTPDSTPEAASAGVNVPTSKIKSAVWDFDYRDIAAEPFTNETASQNVLALISSAATAPVDASNTIVNGENTAGAAVLLATDALSIDAKIDDGNAGTGKVKGLNPGTDTLPTALSTDVTNCYYYASSAFTYNTTNTVKSCALTFQVDIN